MDILFMYVLPPVLGLTVGAAWIHIQRGKLLARTSALVEARTAELLQANERLRQANRKLSEEATTDALTGVLNRRFLKAHLERESARIIRQFESNIHATPGNVLLVIDIDDFKHFNDRNGHVQGDRALAWFADILKRTVRDSDYVVRWGGEEFVVLATDARPEDGAIIADRILESVRAERMFGTDGRAMTMTCSIGVSHFPFFPDHARALHWEQVLQIADLCAYLAKRSGKNAWHSIRGKHFEADFQFERLLDEMASAPDDMFLDESLVVGRSVSVPRVVDETVADI